MAQEDPNRVFVDTTKVRKSLRGFGTVDLFAGAGGMSLGFQQAGFKILSAVEVVGIAAETHYLNFPDSHVHCGDIAEYDPMRVGIANNFSFALRLDS